MPTQAQLINDIVATLDGSVAKFNASMPGVQDKVMAEIELLVKDLELRNGKIVPSAANLRAIAKIKGKLERLIRNPEYVKEVREFAKAFEQLTVLQNQYFETLAGEFKPTPLLQELKNQSISSTIASLTEAGINANLTSSIQDILRTNITSGANYSQMLGQLRNYMTTDTTGTGALERYAKQITTDALNQYSAQYSDVVTNDLGLEWFMWTGSLVQDSRDLCVALHKKQYIHKSEIPAILRGDFAEFREINGRINPKTGLPYGMVPGTNAANFKVYRGGYNCGHQLVPVAAEAVPFAIRAKFSRTAGIDETMKKLGGTEVQRKELAGPISISRKGLKEAINQPHENYLAKNDFITNKLEKALETAKYVGAYPSGKNRPEIKQFHYFEVRIGGKPSYLVIREFDDGKHSFYSVVERIK